MSHAPLSHVASRCRKNPVCGSVAGPWFSRGSVVLYCIGLCSINSSSLHQHYYSCAMDLRISVHRWAVHFTGPRRGPFSVCLFNNTCLSPQILDSPSSPPYHAPKPPFPHPPLIIHLTTSPMHFLPSYHRLNYPSFPSP